MVDSNDNKNGVKIVVTSDDNSAQKKLKTKSNAQKRRLSTISLADIDGNAIEIETIDKNKKGKL